MHCLGFSKLSCQEAIIFWFHGCSHHLQWFWCPREGNGNPLQYSCFENPTDGGAWCRLLSMQRVGHDWATSLSLFTFSSTTVWRHQFFGDLPSLYGPALTRLKHLLTMWGTWVWSLGSIHGQEDPLEKEMATHSSILAWRIHGWRSLVGYSPRGRKELDMTEWLHFHFHWEDYSLDYTDLCWQNNVSAFQHTV